MPIPNFCPKCGATADPELMCPNCGWDIPGERLRRGSKSSVVWGFLAGLALSFTGLGFFVTIVLYFTLRYREPGFARGLAYSLAAIAVLLLGLFAACLVMVGVSASMAGRG